MEEFNIPLLDDKHEEKEKLVSNGSPKLCVPELHWDINLKYNENSKGCTRNNEDTIRNISPQLGEAEEWNTPEQSNSEDSSLSDSDKTLVGDAPDGVDIEAQSWHRRNYRDYKISKQFEIENWDIDDDSDYYFRAMPYTDSTQQKCMFSNSIFLLLLVTMIVSILFNLIILFLFIVLKVLVDKRMRFSTLKKYLEPFVSVPMDYFKVFRLSSSGESECSCLTEQLNSYEDGERLNVKLGRALRSGEFKVKLYQLLIDSTEVCQIFSFFIFYTRFILTLLQELFFYYKLKFIVSLTNFCANGSSRKI